MRDPHACHPLTTAEAGATMSSDWRDAYWLVMTEGDGADGWIVRGTAAAMEALADLLYEPPSAMPTDERDQWDEWLNDEDAWRHDSGQPSEFRYEFEDGGVRVIRVPDEAVARLLKGARP